MTRPADQVTHLIEELGRKGTRPYAGEVGLCDAQHAPYLGGTDARAGDGAAGSAVRRGDEGIGAVVYVEHRRLGSLKKNVLARFELLVEKERALDDVGTQALGIGQVGLADLCCAVAGKLVDLLEDGIGVGQGCLELLAKDLLVEHVLHAQAGAVHLVHIGGTDSTLCGADEILAEPLLVRSVEVLVVGHNDVGVARDLERIAADTLLAEGVDLREKQLGIHDAAVADDGVGSLVHDSRGDLVQSKLMIIGDDGMARICPACVAAHYVETTGYEVGDLALALVTPLRADQY